uniref:Uncharacterized protein n=1 Tax=Panagrolaimus sp. ES5 TaxID=591445 RepID=A0AC34G287_9BILA
MSDESEKLPSCSISLDSYAIQRLERLNNQTRRLNDELKIETEFSNRIEKEHADLTEQLEKMIENEMNKERTWRKNVEVAVKLEEIAKAETAAESVDESEQAAMKKNVKMLKEKIRLKLKNHLKNAKIKA